MKSIVVAQKYVLAACLSVTLNNAVGQTHKALPTDWQIEAQVQKALHDDHICVGSSVMSSVDKGLVKLTGIVRSETRKTTLPLTSPTSQA